MKYIIALLFILFLFNTSSKAQTIVVAGVAPNNYIVHKVVPKESWFSVGRMYNVNARELANYNKLAVDKGLNIDQIIKVPITNNNNATSKSVLAAGEVAIPLYYIVGKSEGLFRVATNCGTTMQALREWNNLQSDQLSTGTTIQVGFLKVKESESPLAVQKATIPAETKENNIPKTETPKPVEPTPVIVKEEPKSEPPPKPKQSNTPIIKEEPKSLPPTKPVQTNIESSKPLNESLSFFKTEFGKNPLQGKSIEGKGASFKTMAGWDDNKFYALIDGIPAGTILQVVNPMNGNTVYVKVLGEMQEIKQNHGLIIRISNAAANALEINEEKFLITIKY